MGVNFVTRRSHLIEIGVGVEVEKPVTNCNADAQTCFSPQPSPRRGVGRCRPEAGRVAIRSAARNGKARVDVKENGGRMHKPIWYQLGVKEVLEELQTSEFGLDGEEAGRRLARHGPNRLAEEEKISRFRILLHQFTSPLIYILLIAGIVTIFLREYIDAGVIFAVVVLNAAIGFFQEHRAEQSVRALKKMVVPRAKVLRGGREKDIPSEELVPGDVVLLASGIKVPADLRLMHIIELRVDESMLTGESVPAGKSILPLREDYLIPGDQRNMAFMGTIAVSGRARGVVVATGRHTVLGQIADTVREVAELQTPLQEKLNRFARVIGLVVLVFSAVVFEAGIILGIPPAEMFLIAVATAVSAIPEGLPVAVTIAMAIGVSRMARRNAIIRKLPAVETLGSTTVIGSDKTGTPDQKRDDRQAGVRRQPHV
jgi:Ca2+-transporting ATPase